MGKRHEAESSGAGGDLLVHVYRSDSADPAEFRVPRISPMMVLDVLLAIQRMHDPAIGFRFSCRVGMCGTCTVRVDGRSVLACQTEIDDSTERIRIDPIAGLPVVRDLVVNTEPFWQEWRSITPYLVPDPNDEVGMDAEPAQIRPDSEERTEIDPSLDCIGCAACFSSCGIASARRDFIGPAAMNRAMVLIADSRDTAGAERLDVVGGESGVDRCHYIYGCSVACPKGLDPARSIRRLRKRRLK
ncbi:succinate dehydrogenase/fumarate reductase iron-sulfur subunit [Saccharopolyspora shandongensis]|uniref:succinate dehydrogenase/fumarate reductase iron-sulfur subunit n=1 Tax=Saccharopolyspora shandongensis TaxID=418495 RepID=UPI0033CF8DFD